jgi:hypothetical protein
MNEKYQQYVGKWVTCGSSSWETSFIKFLHYNGDDKVSFMESFAYDDYEVRDYRDTWCNFDMSSIRVVSTKEMRHMISHADSSTFDYDLVEFDERNYVAQDLVRPDDAYKVTHGLVDLKMSPIDFKMSPIDFKSDVIVRQQKAIV